MKRILFLGLFLVALAAGCAALGELGRGVADGSAQAGVKAANERIAASGDHAPPLPDPAPSSRPGDGVLYQIGLLGSIIAWDLVHGFVKSKLGRRATDVAGGRL